MLERKGLLRFKQLLWHYLIYLKEEENCTAYGFSQLVLFSLQRRWESLQQAKASVTHSTITTDLEYQPT